VTAKERVKWPLLVLSALILTASILIGVCTNEVKLAASVAAASYGAVAIAAGYVHWRV
jgi:hypothetical protein